MCTAGALFDTHLLKVVGFTAEEMKEASLLVRELIRDAGYSGRQLRAAGFTAADFVAAPCSVSEIKAAGFSAKECTEGGLDVEVVAAVYRKQPKPPEKPVPLIQVLQQLRAGGMTIEQAKRGGLLPHECKGAGYSYEEGRAVGFKRKLNDWMTMELANPYNTWS